MRKITFLILTLLSFFIVSAKPDKSDYLVVFYNLENLFDPEDDAFTQDEEFMPQGRYAWTWRKLTKKCNDIAKVLIAAGQENVPTLIGVCEVENRRVLNRLVQATPLSKIGYGIVHRNSPDSRGIDVALLYRTDHFTVLHSTWFKVKYELKSTRTREILYAKGVLHDLDTLHIFVNHWPSKRDGAVKSEPRRMRAAATLRKLTDSIFTTNPAANILVMGDFNDTPESNPIKKGLQAVSDTSCLSCLHNLLLPLAAKGEGSLKYRRKWELIDQFFISGNLLDTLQPLYCPPNEAHVFRAGFLLEQDEKFLGDKVHRTYEAGRYKGGASDHLPIVMTIKRNY